MNTDPRDPSWGEPRLPEKFTSFRPAQLKAIEEIVGHFEAGKKIVVLSAPTGSGKTLCAEVSRRLTNSRSLYLCVDRGLQDQIARDFEYAKILKGRSNYPTLDFPDRFNAPYDPLSAADCNKTKNVCSWCSDTAACPYAIAKRGALAAPLACLNTAYFLLESNGPGMFSYEASKDRLIVVDEGDRLEDVLMNYVEVSISGRDLAEWGIAPLDRSPEPEIVVKWVEQVLKEIGREEAQWDGREPRDLPLKDQKRLRHLITLARRLEAVAEEYEDGGWVTVQETLDRSSRTIFRPVRVDRFAQRDLWAHGPRWLVMSATILSAERTLADLGVTDPEDWAVVSMPSTFDPKRRPVHALAVCSVTYKNRDESPGKLAKKLDEILASHPSDRILVHTFSYQLQRGILDRLDLSHEPRLIPYGGANSRADALEDYLNTPAGVLIAPALERGVDLPDDACRVVVICKVPFPYLGDPQVAARQRSPGGEDWYLDRTVRALVQMTGRGMRHAEDHCVSYILDAEFNRIFRQDLRAFTPRFPSWWTDAVRL